MDIELPSNRGRTPPGMALAVATIVAAGVTGMAVAGLTWALERPAAQSTGAPPDLAAVEPAPSPTGPVDTPGWSEALGLPAPAPVPSGGDVVPLDGLGPADRPAVPGTAEATRRAAAAARRPVAGPTASTVRSTPTATTAAAAPAPTSDPSASAADPGLGDPGVPDPDVSDPGVSDPDVSDPDVADPGTADPGVADPGAEDPTATATETSPPDPGRRSREAPRRQWRDQPPQEPADPAPWSGPFGDFPRLFPWG